MTYRDVPLAAGMWEPARQILDELVDPARRHVLDGLHPHGLDGPIVVIGAPHPADTARSLGRLLGVALGRPFRLVRCDHTHPSAHHPTTEEVTR